MISSFADSLPSSGIRKMMHLASGMHDVAHLEVGEPSFQTPAHIVEAGAQAARSGATRYTPTAGTPGLRMAVAERMSRRWDRTVSADEVLISSGAVGALTAAVLATVSEGDEILLPDPGWPNYHSMALLSRAEVKFYHLRSENGFMPDLEEVRGLIGPRTRAMLINTPANPTGAVFTREVIQALVALSREHDFTLISDEIYEDIVFDCENFSAGRLDDRVIYVSGFSKSYAMTGWRVGFAVAPPAVISAMEKIQEPLVSCVSSISQAAAEAALSGPQESVAEMRAVYQRRRDDVARRLSPHGILPVAPQGAFYAFLDLSGTGLSGMQLAQELLSEARVATAPGITFGESCGQFVRISFALGDDELAAGCDRLLEFWQRRRAKIAS